MQHANWAREAAVASTEERRGLTEIAPAHFHSFCNQPTNQPCFLSIGGRRQVDRSTNPTNHRPPPPPPSPTSSTSTHHHQHQHHHHNIIFITYLLGNRPRTSDWPKMTECQIMRLILTFIIDLKNDIIDKKSLLVVGARGVNLIGSLLFVNVVDELRV